MMLKRSTKCEQFQRQLGVTAASYDFDIECASSKDNIYNLRV